MKPTKYEPKVVRVTEGERKNGWTEEELLAYLRRSNHTEFELRRDLLHRAKDHEHYAHAAVAKFKKDEDLTTPENLKHLAELEREAAEASADAAYAADRYTETSEAAA